MDREQDERKPLDRDSTGPGRAGSNGTAGLFERQRAGDERHRRGVVVTAPSEVNGQQWIPADECDGKHAPAGNERRACGRGENGKRAERLVDPRGGGRRSPRRQGDGLGGKRECRPVHGGRLAPGIGNVTEGRIGRVPGGWIDIRVSVVDGRNASVVPVDPRVRGQHQRCGNGRELNRDRKGSDRGESHVSGPDRGETGDVHDVRRGQASEETHVHPVAPASLPGTRTTLASSRQATPLQTATKTTPSTPAASGGTRSPATAPADLALICRACACASRALPASRDQALALDGGGRVARVREHRKVTRVRNELDRHAKSAGSDAAAAE